MAKHSSHQVRKKTELASIVIEEHFGIAPKKISHKPTGLTNLVYEISLPDQELIVRISNDPTKYDDFLKEQWAVTKVKKVGVPVAEILEVGNKIISKPYMIQQKIDGIIGDHCNDRLKIINQMGAYTALINSVETSNYGGTFDWSKNKLSRNETWLEYLQNELQVKKCINILKKNKMLSPSKLKALESNLRKIEEWNFKPVLNHGDMRLKNVIVNDAAKIIAILDWELCNSNIAPYWDLCFALHDLGIDEKQEFLKGYQLPPKKFEEMSAAIKVFNVLHYALEMDKPDQKKGKDLLEEYRLRLNGCYDLYSF
jgi:hygromycin-B 4-O-kinase